MAKRPHASLADYVAIAICPALIMALVGSLVFFLLEVSYGGRYEGRMQMILFCFVFAAVLIARISMTAGISERAPIYGVVLGVAVWLALSKFVEFPPGTPLASFSWAINLGLIALIWWATHKLTWDCTYIDDNVDSSGAGLLEVTGLEKNATPLPEPEEVTAPDSDKKTEASGWWARYQEYRERQRTKPHAPGVWIVYFSLAALPLFGLGQVLIPTTQTASRQYAFWLMTIYVASGLGLLLTTSYLGLRRYLRQRNLEMPVAMTGVWLGIGGVLIATLLIVGTFLPRPNAEYSLLSFTKLGSKERDASRYSPGGSEPGKGEGRSGSQGAKEGEGNATGKGSESGGKGQGQGQSGSGKGQDGKGGGDKQGGDSSQSNSQPGKGQDQSSKQAAEGNKQSQSRNQDSDSSEQKGESDSSTGSSTGSTALPPLNQLFTSISTVFKWIVFVIVGLIVAFLVLRALLRFLSNFTGWARGMLAALDRLWKSLFGWWGQPSTAAVEDAGDETKSIRRPFSSFANPFHTGMSGSPEELVRYSFEALEAWSWEHGLPRNEDDTPIEFAEQIGMEHPALASEARRLASYYARAAYGRGRLPATTLDALRQFWNELDVAQEPTLSR